VPTPSPAPTAGTGWRYALKPIFDLLGHTEGTDKRLGYNESLAYGALTGGDKNLVGMTLLEIDSLQTQMLNHPKNKWNSSALGRYQIVRTTLRKLRKGFPQAALFDGDLQDVFAAKLLVGRGLLAWLAGTKSTVAFVNQLAREWASIPTSSGNGYYSGQRVGATVRQVTDALAQVKARMTGDVLADIKNLTT